MEGYILYLGKEIKGEGGTGNIYNDGFTHLRRAGGKLVKVGFSW